ncbi:helicase associated domain-containing protein, partial [Streptomyces sp. NPDC089799]|uniref:helicase associated domain-containing protein n=1 Tax=Streptomyces sp. NPDC089799 TaxID=3155066 RepID=UPI00342723F2
GTLAAPRHAIALDKPVGQWLTNIRRPGGLGKDPARARRRAAALTAIDPDWNPGENGWTVDWQRHHAYLAQLLDDGALLDAIVPGVTRHGEDIGRWLATQRRDYHRLNAEQQHRLAELGVTAAPAGARRAPAMTSTVSTTGRGAEAFHKGLAALQQYLAREGSLMRIPRSHVETVRHDGQEVEVRLGVWRSNMRSRRGSLPEGQRRQLEDLGLFD